MFKISVIICAHNPRDAYIQRTLEALRLQTLEKSQWELLLVDNGSKRTLSEYINLDWHSCARHTREEELGLTPARLRGIKEASGEILVFVDDDNILDANYLEQTLVIAQEWPWVGAWGGRISPEFEVPAPEWCKEELWRLAVIQVERDVWSNLREGFVTMPVGAGMCIRRQVGEKFVERCLHNQGSKKLDRTGTQLSGYGDMDLAHCAMDIGLGTGKTPRLHLTHLIPASRLTLDYFLRHAESDAASYLAFHVNRGLPVKRPASSFVSNLKWLYFRYFSRNPLEIRKIHAAHRRGMKKGWKLLAAMESNHGSA